MKNYEIKVIRSLRPSRRVHPVTVYCVLGENEADATSKLRTHLNELGYVDAQCEYMGEPNERSDIQVTLFTSCTPAELRELKGLPKPEQKPTPERKLSTRKLGETQLSVLKSLHDHGKWPGGWVWNTDSGTNRILDGLYQRCLVDRVDPHKIGYFGTYTINAEGLKAIGKGQV